MKKTGVQREDFREVTPTAEEKTAWFKDRGRAPFTLPYRVVHIPCGKRMWYSGLGIGSHLRACKPEPKEVLLELESRLGPNPLPPGPRIGIVQSSQLGDDWRPSTHLR